MLGEIKLKKKTLWRNILDKYACMFDRDYGRMSIQMNIFGLIGIFVLLSGIGYGVILVLILMENLK